MQNILDSIKCGIKSMEKESKGNSDTLIPKIKIDSKSSKDEHKKNQMTGLVLFFLLVIVNMHLIWPQVK